MSISSEGLGDSPRVVEHRDIFEVMHAEGRSERGIYPPIVFGHYGQMLAREFANFAKEIMADKGVDDKLANSIAARLSTLGLRHFVNLAEFGYAERVLEERAGLDSAEQSTQSIEAVFVED